ncbi:hypothetical protein [Sphingomonas parapaucimobilis]
MPISEFECQCGRRLEQWARINAAIGFGVLALTVVLLMLAAYAWAAR